MNISIVVYDKRSFDIGKTLYDDIRSYIDERLVREELAYERRSRFDLFRSSADESCGICAPLSEEKEELSLEEALKQKDRGFSEALFSMIDDRGLTDSECYHRANIDRKLFSKMKKPDYHPKKVTVIALAIALQLDLDETEELLMKAGYALSDSSEFDIIIEYCIEKKIYDVIKVNEILFKFDQVLLGV